LKYLCLLFLIRAAYKKGKKERPPFLPAPLQKKEEESPVPAELICPLCKDMLNDAVVIPCCGNSYCDECKYNPSLFIMFLQKSLM